jgi:hypothetical protein
VPAGRGGGARGSGRLDLELLARGPGERGAALLADAGLEPSVCRHLLHVPAHHPFLRLPLQFAAALRPRLLGFLDETALDALLADAQGELAAGVAGTSFTLVQTWGRVPG